MSSTLKIATPSAVMNLTAAFILAACQLAPTPIPSASPPPTFTVIPTAIPTRAPTLPPTPTIPPRSATLCELQQKVDARSDSAVQWREAIEGQSVLVGGGVKTRDEARARLDISDGTVMRMAANSEFTLTELTPGPREAVTRFKLALGKLWVALAGTAGEGVFEIETPVGVATVRGSYISVELAEDTGQAVVTCLEGECRLTGTTGQATDLSHDQQATIAGAGQNPSPAQPMEAAQYADWARNFPEAPAPPLTSILLSPGDGQCSPNTFPAGVVELTMGVGRWMTPEEAAAAIGDSNPTITLNGEPVTIHDRTGPERHPGDDPAWGFSVRTYVMLEPGEYTITSQWHWDLVFNCVIEVTGP